VAPRARDAAPARALTREAGLLQTRLQMLAFVRTVTTLLAYGAFLNLLRIEGRRSIGAHTEIAGSCLLCRPTDNPPARTPC
jgi:hypothetical protein